MVIYYQWCKTEGSIIPNLTEHYGQLYNITTVFYGTPEINISNPFDLTNGAKYKIVPISEFGYHTIREIDDNWYTFQCQIQAYSKDAKDATLYTKPFVITESSIILHCDSTSDVYTNIGIIFVDKFATASIVGISANYNGSDVPIGNAFDVKNMNVTCIYSDGSTAKIDSSSYIVTPTDKIITVKGSNVFTIDYLDDSNKKYSCTVIVPGIKSLIGISGVYDGQKVAIGEEALKSNFVITAHYSDGSSNTITSFSFPNGNLVTNNNFGIIQIYYEGFETSVKVDTYTVTTSQLMAYYNGPNVEVGHEFQTKYVNVKVYYSDGTNENNYYESISVEKCTFSTKLIDHEGINHISIGYQSKTGMIYTNIMVAGINPKVVLEYITATYSGPPICVGKTFNVSKILCKGYYSNGTVSNITSFAISSNYVSVEGDNTYIVSFDGKFCQVSVIGIPTESTSENGIVPSFFNNKYPEATRENHRYRGPVESYKLDAYAGFLYENITEINEIFKDIEKQFNRVVDEIQIKNNSNAKLLNCSMSIDDQIRKIKESFQ